MAFVLESDTNNFALLTCFKSNTIDGDSTSGYKPLSLSSYPLFLSLSLSFFFLPLSSAFFPSLSFSSTTLLSSIGIFHAVHLNAFLSLSISYLLLRSISVCPPHDAANYFPSRRCCNN